MHVSHASGLGSRPVACGIGLWKFISRPSILETVSLLIRIHGHINGGVLTGFEWDIKESLRMTSSLAVTTFSVLISPCTCRASWCGGYGLHFGLESLGCHGMTLCSWARCFTCVCTVLTQEWMGTWLNSDCLCLSSFQCCDGSRGCMLPRELSWYWNEEVP